MIARVAIANKSMTSTPIINGNLPIDEKLLIRAIQNTNLRVVLRSFDIMETKKNSIQRDEERREMPAGDPTDCTIPLVHRSRFNLLCYHNLPPPPQESSQRSSDFSSALDDMSEITFPTTHHTHTPTYYPSRLLLYIHQTQSFLHPLPPFHTILS
jgi:hypothetical protein